MVFLVSHWRAAGGGGWRRRREAGRALKDVSESRAFGARRQRPECPPPASARRRPAALRSTMRSPDSFPQERRFPCRALLLCRYSVCPWRRSRSWPSTAPSSRPRLRRGANNYVLGPDSQLQPGVPQGTVTQYSWASKIYPGTVRDYWVYVPAQYDAADAGLRDGLPGRRRDTSSRTARGACPVVFDNLIAQEGDAGHDRRLHQPGRGAGADRRRAAALQPQLRVRQPRATATRGSCSRRSCPRSASSTTCAPTATSRAIGGASSGAIAAFTAAWERPDAFSRVFSTIGTYVGLRGGNDLPDAHPQDRAEAAPRLPAGRLATT